MRCYYDIKYPYLNYSYTDTDGNYIMFSLPPLMLIEEYKARFKREPKTFFDCGAAIGMIVRLAIDCGLDAHGIDIKKYPPQQQSFSRMKHKDKLYAVPTFILQELFTNGRIEIKSILDYDTIDADIAYCNGTLTYFDEKILPHVLSKFKNVGMLCAIHNTTEDVQNAKTIGETLSTCNKTRIIKTNDWWIKTFNKNGFNAQLNYELRTFIAIPYQR